MNLTTTWASRAAWLLLAVTAGPCLAAALGPTHTGFRTVASVLLWVGWAAALTALLFPRTISLTAIRTIVPCAVVAAGWAAMALPAGTPLWKPLLALGWSFLAVGLALSPAVADEFVNGSAYGPERRMSLRLPGALLLLAPASWVTAAVGFTAGPLLLSARQWVGGTVVLLLGWPAGVVAVRALHGLARRWVVFVPSGLVLHDLFDMPDAVLFPRRMVRSLGPAPADVEAFDCTGGAPGLALLLVLTEPLSIGVRDGRNEVGSVEVERLRFTPARPGAVLAEAAARRLPVGGSVAQPR